MGDNKSVSEAKAGSNLYKCFSHSVLSFWILIGLAACSDSGGESPSRPIADVPDSPADRPVVPGSGDAGSDDPGGGDSGSADETPEEQIPNDQGPANVPDSVVAMDGIDLVVSTEQRCAVVNQPLEVSVKQKSDQPEATVEDYPNVTGYVSFSQSLGSSLRLLSRTDESANFAMSIADIVGLTSSIDDGSVTVYLASHFADAPDPFILRKTVSGGCAYAFRSNDYCATGLARNGTVSFARDGYTVSATNCDLNNPDNLPVIELSGSTQ